MVTATVICEVCVDGVTGAGAAQTGGAHRLELCQALSVGGITPSAGMIQQVKVSVDLPVHVLIRPRPGNFHFDAAEFAVMRRDIELAGEWGADGVVIGMLRQDGTVDVDGVGRLIEAARPMSVTFHRAFDVTPDAASALGALIALHVDRVLTSGQAASAWEGRQLLARLVEAAAQRLIVMPGAGIDEINAGDLVRETGVREIHFSARREVVVAPSGGEEGVRMGSDASADRVLGVTDVDRVRNTAASAAASFR